MDESVRFGWRLKGFDKKDGFGDGVIPEWDLANGNAGKASGHWKRERFPILAG